MTSKRLADVVWRDGVPIANAFDDPYYSLAGGLAESRFVFLQGANVVERAKERELFTIGETGFGTGLNFLATWQAWRKHHVQCRLVFVSTEAFPMSIEDMEMAHKAFPELADMSAQLRANMPPPSRGFHPRTFEDGKVKLLLLQGFAQDMFRQLHGAIDAWYLDGFAPAKNPDMWTEELFKQIGRLSTPAATLATFTAAGFVRRGLIEHGFEMRKAPGFAHKRERLVGDFRGFDQGKSPAIEEALPGWSTPPVASAGKTVGIIGGGIAGATLAMELSQVGLKPTIVQSKKHQKASALPAAILAPRFMLDDLPEREFFSAAYANAISYSAYQKAMSGISGIQYLAMDDKECMRHQRILEDYGWPASWMTLDAKGLHLNKCGTLNAPEALQELTEGTPTLQADAKRIERDEKGWQIFDTHGQHLATFDIVIVAAGPNTLDILDASGLAGKAADNTLPEIRLSAGQIEIFDSDMFDDLPKETLSFGNYVSAAIEGESGSIRTAGSTFDRVEESELPISPSRTATHTILSAVTSVTNTTQPASLVTKSWTGTRATTPDHLPYAGPVPDWGDLKQACEPMRVDATAPANYNPKSIENLFVLGGLGSKGFQYAPLLARYITAMIVGEPLPLPATLIAKVHPGRGLVRAVKKGAH